MSHTRLHHPTAISSSMRHDWLACAFMRLGTALLAGHLLAFSASHLIITWLPMPETEVVLTRVLLQLLTPGLTLIWAFSIRSQRLACLGTLLPGLGLSLLTRLTY
ncbi:MAG: DUF3649 domain-containing protein [Perlucidibaca sp.]